MPTFFQTKRSLVLLFFVQYRQQALSSYQSRLISFPHKLRLSRHVTDHLCSVHFACSWKTVRDTRMHSNKIACSLFVCEWSQNRRFIIKFRTVQFVRGYHMTGTQKKMLISELGASQPFPLNVKYSTYDIRDFLVILTLRLYLNACKNKGEVLFNAEIAFIWSPQRKVKRAFLPSIQLFSPQTANALSTVLKRVL